MDTVRVRGVRGRESKRKRENNEIRERAREIRREKEREREKGEGQRTCRFIFEGKGHQEVVQGLQDRVRLCLPR